MATNPLASVRVVLTSEVCRDPALDPKMDFEAYEENFDESLIKVREGMTPTWFYVSQLKQSWIANQIDTLSHSSQRLSLAMQASCHRIEAPGRDAMEPDDGEWVSKKDAVPRIAGPGWFDRVADEHGMEAVYALGAIALRRARVGKKARGPLG